MRADASSREPSSRSAYTQGSGQGSALFAIPPRRPEVARGQQPQSRRVTRGNSGNRGSGVATLEIRLGSFQVALMDSVANLPPYRLRGTLDQYSFDLGLATTPRASSSTVYSASFSPDCSWRSLLTHQYEVPLAEASQDVFNALGSLSVDFLRSRYMNIECCSCSSSSSVVVGKCSLSLLQLFESYQGRDVVAPLRTPPGLGVTTSPHVVAGQLFFTARIEQVFDVRVNLTDITVAPNPLLLLMPHANEDLAEGLGCVGVRTQQYHTRDQIVRADGGGESDEALHFPFVPRVVYRGTMRGMLEKGLTVSLHYVSYCMPGRPKSRGASAVSNASSHTLDRLLCDFDVPLDRIVEGVLTNATTRGSTGLQQSFATAFTSTVRPGNPTGTSAEAALSAAAAACIASGMAEVQLVDRCVYIQRGARYGDEVLHERSEDVPSSRLQQPQQQYDSSPKSLAGRPTIDTHAPPSSHLPSSFLHTNASHANSSLTSPPSSSNKALGLREITEQQDELVESIQSRLVVVQGKRRRLAERLEQIKQEEREDMLAAAEVRGALEQKLAIHLQHREALEVQLRRVEERREEVTAELEVREGGRRRAGARVAQERAEVERLREKLQELQRDMEDRVRAEEVRSSAYTRRAETAQREVAAGSKWLCEIDSRIAEAERNL